MKKYISICIIISILLTGCSKKEINKPYEVIIGNNILSYYDTKDNITNDFNVLDLSVKNNQDTSSNNIIVNKDGKIRCISIIDNTITTYKQIYVGDNISKIEENFEYESKFNENYLVIFNGEVEEDTSNQNKEDNWVWIEYITDGSKITQIRIYDVEYGLKLK